MSKRSRGEQMYNSTIHLIKSAAVAGLIAFSLPVMAMAEDGTDATQAVLNHHLEAFGTADMDAILSDYTDSSVLLFNDVKLTGTAEIKGLFVALFDEFGKPGMNFEMLQMQVDGRLAYIVWTAETADNVYEVATDTMVVEDGKIVYQTVAGKITPK